MCLLFFNVKYANTYFCFLMFVVLCAAVCVRACVRACVCVCFGGLYRYKVSGDKLFGAEMFLGTLTKFFLGFF